MRQRGAVLLVVLAALVVLAFLGGHAARFGHARQREAADAWCRELARAIHDDSRGGQVHMGHATIGDRAMVAPSSEGFHGSQTFPPGRDACVRRGFRGARRIEDHPADGE
jgi:hypothetical protein